MEVKESQDLSIYKKLILDKAVKKSGQELKDIKKAVDEITKYCNTDIDVINAAFDRLNKDASVDNKAIEVVKDVINDGIIENQYLELVVPFFTDNTNYTQFINLSFEAIDFSSEKLSKVVNALFYNKGGHDGAAEIVCVYNYIKRDVINLELFFEKDGKRFDFLINDIKLFAFERHINFLVFDAELKLCDNMLPSLSDIADFSSFICRVRDDVKRFNNPIMSKSFKEIINEIIGGYNPHFVGNNFPKSLEEKPKIIGSTVLKYAFSDQKFMLEKITLLANNLPLAESDKVSKEEKSIRHTQNSAMLISKNGVYSVSLNDTKMQYRQEYLISYLLCLYEHYARLDFLDNIGIGNFCFDEGSIEKTLEKILNLKNDYVMFKVSSAFEEYTRIDLINDDVYYWKAYFNKSNLKHIFEQELAELEEVSAVLEKKSSIKKAKLNERRTKKIELAAVLITSVLMLFSITEGIFKLYDRITSITDSVYNIVKIAAAFVIWIVVVFVTLKKTKK